MKTIDVLKTEAAELQRTAPGSEAAKAAQRAHQQAINDEAANRRAAEYRADEAERIAHNQRLREQILAPATLPLTRPVPP